MAAQPAPPASDRLSDSIRRAVLDEPGSVQALADAAGLRRSIVARFAAGSRGLNLESADKLAATLGLRLVATRRRPRKA